MRLRVIGSGDAFGSGGRFNTCFMLETAKGVLLVDFGASSLVALKAHGIDPLLIDGIVISHLHGDHFGALPFLLLDGQFLARRERPLTIAGPPGSRARINQLLEVFFPRSTSLKWRFPWQVVEIEIGRETEILGHSVLTAEVIHRSGAPSTGVRSPTVTSSSPIRATRSGPMRCSASRRAPISSSASAMATPVS